MSGVFFFETHCTLLMSELTEQPLSKLHQMWGPRLNSINLLRHLNNPFLNFTEGQKMHGFDIDIQAKIEYSLHPHVNRPGLWSDNWRHLFVKDWLHCWSFSLAFCVGQLDWILCKCLLAWCMQHKLTLIVWNYPLYIQMLHSVERDSETGLHLGWNDTQKGQCTCFNCS